jgi:Prenyltransferase and squalene oxidase repeat
MISWRNDLRVDPLPRLTGSGNPPIAYFARRDLADEAVQSIEVLWDLPAAGRILRRQRADGSWKYPGQEKAPHQNYALLETFRNLGFLVEQLGFDRRHPAIEWAAGYLFSCQSAEGDFRGIYSQQYTTTYSPAVMELLIKAGYGDDPRIEQGFHWLLSIRQSDGGWTIPFLTTGMSWDEGMRATAPIPPDRSKPFSHLATGCVLRAFAAHPRERRTQEALQAGALLASRLFKAEKYSGRDAAGFWERVSFPFWFTDIVSALDSLSLLGFTARDPAIASALDCLRDRQRADGSFALGLLRAGADKDTQSWVDMAICRVFKRCVFHADSPGARWHLVG